jgi:hypothetical protein
MSHPNVTDPAFDMKSSDAQIVSMLDKTGQPALIERAKAILRKILTKNARVSVLGPCIGSPVHPMLLPHLPVFADMRLTKRIKDLGP